MLVVRFEAKFKVPRCVEMFSSKEYEKLWRPTCHLVCALVHGVVECYFIMDSDMKKDSNMNCTVINRAIDITMGILRERGVEPPHHICLQADNTCREQRNQFVFTWCALATAKGLWATVSPVFYIPGHTHNEVDQRFVPVAAALSRAKKLETCQERSFSYSLVQNISTHLGTVNLPSKSLEYSFDVSLATSIGETLSPTPLALQDFVDCLKTSLKPSRERELHVEWLHSFYDWQAYMEPLEVSLSGIAIVNVHDDVNFSFRMVQRQDLKAYQGFDKWLEMTDDKDM